MELLAVVAALVVALFWTVIVRRRLGAHGAGTHPHSTLQSIFTPFLATQAPPPPASRSDRQRRKTRPPAPDVLVSVQPLPATAPKAPVLESSSEASSLFSTAASSINSDYDTSNEPLTPVASEELSSATSCAPPRPYRRFSDFKTTFTTPFAKRRSATIDLTPTAPPPVRPGRERSRSTSRTRAPFGAIFGIARSQTFTSSSSDDVPLTPDSMTSSAKSFGAISLNQAQPPRVSTKPRTSLPLNMPPLSRLQQRRVSAPAAGPSVTINTEPRPPLTPSPSDSPASDAPPLPSTSDAAVERGRPRRPLWKRAFSKPGDEKQPPESKTKKPKSRASSTCPDSPRTPQSASRPSVDADAIISDRRYESSGEGASQAPVRTRTWFERREERARRARSVDRVKRDRHSISAQIAHEAWVAPVAPT
ncbi:hypothetical protein EXIGLDRAFT_745571 [Exidia glandulosa HHB12029]|uniref:Uncharacterized protein n=1 Tax=Exidia glandulosa HHB12029 TaxID=1314781 RepID=A0A165NC44_EXIGL|nr:hypothetical protein EXIGLDRAFT_745571 [Exidia glandulosa HHB12029]